MLTGSPASISSQRWTQFLTRVLFYLASQLFISTFSQQSGALENKPHLMPIADKKVKEAAIVLSRHGRVQTISHIFLCSEFSLHGFILHQFALLFLFLFLSYSISFCLYFSLLTVSLALIVCCSFLYLLYSISFARTLSLVSFLSLSRSHIFILSHILSHFLSQSRTFDSISSSYYF